MTYFNVPSKLLFLRADNSSNTNKKGNVQNNKNTAVLASPLWSQKGWMNDSYPSYLNVSHDYSVLHATIGPEADEEEMHNMNVG